MDFASASFFYLTNLVMNERFINLSTEKLAQSCSIMESLTKIKIDTLVQLNKSAYPVDLKSLTYEGCIKDKVLYEHLANFSWF